MSGNEAYVTIFGVVGFCHLVAAYMTWSRRGRWEADAKRWKGWLGWFSGQRQLNAELALSVLFLGLAAVLT
ncbi:hypothetical protein ACIP93_33725 [Streptomyces sp. NPDC088745]|uniref:hypothetical protein n=1 Tax=Streptomyces sp. NPDC088745 TaxID=3365884 RepID=UPI0037FE0E17